MGNIPFEVWAALGLGWLLLGLGLAVLFCRVVRYGGGQ